MENEKIYEMMFTMYQEMKEGFTTVQSEMKEIRNEIKAVDEKVNTTNIMIENVVAAKIDSLYDGYVQHTQQIERIENKVDVMQSDIDHLTIKTLAQNDKIVDISRRVK